MIPLVNQNFIDKIFAQSQGIYSEPAFHVSGGLEEPVRVMVSQVPEGMQLGTTVVLSDGRLKILVDLADITLPLSPFKKQQISGASYTYVDGTSSSDIPVIGSRFIIRGISYAVMSVKNGHWNKAHIELADPSACSEQDFDWCEKIKVFDCVE